MAMEVVLPDLHEALIYVEGTTRARPNPQAEQGCPHSSSPKHILRR